MDPVLKESIVSNDSALYEKDKARMSVSKADRFVSLPPNV